MTNDSIIKCIWDLLDDPIDPRLDWNIYFLLLAKVASKRSHDIQTQHGCVITIENKIVGIGYNGFPRGMKDHILPNTRPAKYDWMIHSEINAINNCVLPPTDGVAYVTGEPCNNCLMQLWQNGIHTVKFIASHGSHLINDETREIRHTFLQQTGMNWIPLDLDQLL